MIKDANGSPVGMPWVSAAVSQRKLTKAGIAGKTEALPAMTQQLWRASKLPPWVISPPAQGLELTICKRTLKSTATLLKLKARLG